ncbi:MAG: DUF4097 family beta strand repeat protein [Candidatus Didemnitutus sp.]|nr:DUF4097 family beta strand repeat protein [Candidatus Didemnitutus sp.]
MKNPLHLLRFGAACAALALSAAALHAAEDSTDQNTVRSKFSDASKPGTLKVALPWAEVRVSGTDGNEIVVTSSLEQKGKKEVDQDGFRRLDEDVTFEITEKNNVATIVMTGDNPWAAQGAEFNVQVPHNTNLVLRTEAGGDIKVENIDGDIDINSMNGEVALLDIGASAVVNTMNGEVTATFKKAPAKPVSITSMNGEVDVRLPSDTKANLRMRTHNGTIRTNFADNILQTKTEKVSGKGFSYGYGMTHDQARELARHAERMARDAARQARAHAAMIRGDKDANDDKDDDQTPEPPEPAAAPEAPATVTTAVTASTPDTTNVSVGKLTAAPRAPLPPLPGGPVGKSIVGTLNGGGVDIQLSTMNGTITLRQTK